MFLLCFRFLAKSFFCYFVVCGNGLNSFLVDISAKSRWKLFYTWLLLSPLKWKIPHSWGHHWRTQVVNKALGQDSIVRPLDLSVGRRAQFCGKTLRWTRQFFEWAKCESRRARKKEIFVSFRHGFRDIHDEWVTGKFRLLFWRILHWGGNLEMTLRMTWLFLQHASGYALYVICNACIVDEAACRFDVFAVLKGVPADVRSTRSYSNAWHIFGVAGPRLWKTERVPQFSNLSKCRDWKCYANINRVRSCTQSFLSVCMCECVWCAKSIALPYLTMTSLSLCLSLSKLRWGKRGWST